MNLTMGELIIAVFLIVVVVVLLIALIKAPTKPVDSPETIERRNAYRKMQKLHARAIHNPTDENWDNYWKAQDEYNRM